MTPSYAGASSSGICRRVRVEGRRRQQFLRGHTKGADNAIEAGEQSGKMHGFGDLELAPSRSSNLGDVRRSEVTGMVIDPVEETQQYPVRCVQSRRREIAGHSGFEQICRVTVLQQRCSMAVSTVVAAIARRQKGRDKLLIATAQGTFTEEHGFGKTHHVFE